MSITSNELVLFADNDSGLYHQSHLPIIANLKKKAAKGKYDSTLAAKLWRYHADRAAQKYVKEFGGGKWHVIFSTADRNEAARDWEKETRAEVCAKATTGGKGSRKSDVKKRHPKLFGA